MRRGDYGYDAPYFPVIFGFLSVVAPLDPSGSGPWGPGSSAARKLDLYIKGKIELSAEAFQDLLEQVSDDELRALITAMLPDEELQAAINAMDWSQ